MSAVDVAAGAIKPVWNFRYKFPNLFMRSFMYGMVGSLAMFITSWEKADRARDAFADKSTDDIYDFIVVGGGTAGSLVANRLASASYKVLLLEAGGEPHPFTQIPFLANFMSSYPETDWMHESTPQKFGFFGSEGGRAFLSSGKGLGGTSNLDYMMYLRGHPRDYDEWVKAAGDPSWSYEKLRKFFMKHEDYKGPWKGKNDPSSRRGELPLQLPPYSKLSSRFVLAGAEMGYPNSDLNSPDYSESFDRLTFPMSLGHRDSSYKSFLKHPPYGLKIHRYSHVTRVLTRGPNQEAYGVEYIRHGKLRHVLFKKEVILSAGTINSPKILMLSGFGPVDHLQALGIPVKVHHPFIGQNLQDHVAVPLGPFFTEAGESLVLDRDLSAMSYLSWSMGSGPLTTTGYEAAAFLSSTALTQLSSGNPHWPDIQLTMHGVGLHSTVDDDLIHARRLKRSVVEPYYKDLKGRDAFTILVSATRPKSRGQLRLRDNNPLTPPEIEPNYLSEVDDVGVLLEGMKKSLRMVESTLQFQRIRANFTERAVPGCEPYKFRSEEYLACFARVLTLSMGDLVGTLSMGKVVDSSLRLQGAQRLRVIDASVMPSLPSGGAMAATLMVAEKGADMLLSYWGKSKNFKETPTLATLASSVKSKATEASKVETTTEESASSAWGNLLKNIRALRPSENEVKVTTQTLKTTESPLRLFSLGSLFGSSSKTTSTTTKRPSPSLSSLFQFQGQGQRSPSPLSTKSKEFYSFVPKKPVAHYRFAEDPDDDEDSTSSTKKPSSVSPSNAEQMLALFQSQESPASTPSPLTSSQEGGDSPLFQPASYLSYPVLDHSAPSSSSTLDPQSPYIITPKTTPSPLLSIPTKKTFTSSVDSIVEQYHPIFNPMAEGPKFSKTLPILGFSKVKGQGSGSDQEVNSYHQNGEQPKTLLLVPQFGRPVFLQEAEPSSLNLDQHVTKFMLEAAQAQALNQAKYQGHSQSSGTQAPALYTFTRPVRAENSSVGTSPTSTPPTMKTTQSAAQSTSSQSPLKILVEAPLKMVTGPIKLVSQAFRNSSSPFKGLGGFFSSLGQKKESKEKDAVVNFKLTLTPTRKPASALTTYDPQTTQNNNTFFQYPQTTTETVQPLAGNVRHILENQGDHAKAFASLPPIPVPVQLSPSTFYRHLEEDEKLLGEEVQKLMSLAPARSEPQILADYSSPKGSLAFTKMIREMMEQQGRRSESLGKKTLDPEASSNGSGKMPSSFTISILNEKYSQRP